MKDPMQLGKRTREIMEVVYSRGEATANDVVAALAHPPSRTAVRTFLRILEERGHLSHRKEGKEYVYKPTQAKGPVGKSALRRVLQTFFDGSLEEAVAAHLADPKTKVSADELTRLRDLIERARAGGE